jgi:hypothetical protein
MQRQGEEHMQETKTRGPSPLTAAILTGLVVGMPAGFMLGDVVGGHRAAPPTSRAVAHGEVGHGAADPFRQSMTRMHEGMTVKPSGDVDLDFARGMVPHHQGAIDMAEVELEKGSDPTMRRLAQSVITSQEAEIAGMRKWIAQRERDGKR